MRFFHYLVSGNDHVHLFQAHKQKISYQNCLRIASCTRYLEETSEDTWYNSLHCQIARRVYVEQ